MRQAVSTAFCGKFSIRILIFGQSITVPPQILDHRRVAGSIKNGSVSGASVKKRSDGPTVNSRKCQHFRRCYIRSPAEGTGGGRGSKSGRNGSHRSRACSLSRHAVKSQPGRSVGRSSGASSNMASRWQSSAGSDARSATASDWSISKWPVFGSPVQTLVQTADTVSISPLLPVLAFRVPWLCKPGVEGSSPFVSTCW